MVVNHLLNWMILQVGRWGGGTSPIASMYMVYLPTWMVDFYGLGQWLLFLVPLKGGKKVAHNHPPEGKDYKWYISGILPANWGMDYATDPTF